jgi:hypothetical protein
MVVGEWRRVWLKAVACFAGAEAVVLAIMLTSYLL